MLICKAILGEKNEENTQKKKKQAKSSLNVATLSCYFPRYQTFDSKLKNLKLIMRCLISQALNFFRLYKNMSLEINESLLSH